MIFTVDTETGFPRVAVISAAWGLGETVLQGLVDPDKDVVFKPLLAKPEARPIIEKTCGGKAIRMNYAEGGSKHTRIVESSLAERRKFVRRPGTRASTTADRNPDPMDSFDSLVNPTAAAKV